MHVALKQYAVLTELTLPVVSCLTRYKMQLPVGLLLLLTFTFLLHDACCGPPEDNVSLTIFKLSLKSTAFVNTIYHQVINNCLYYLAFGSNSHHLVKKIPIFEINGICKYHLQPSDQHLFLFIWLLVLQEHHSDFMHYPPCCHDV